MLKTYHIEVTQEDISESSSGCLSCPIALALKRIFNRELPVSPLFIHNNIDVSKRIGELPQVARDFIQNYDNRYNCNVSPIRPFSFDIALDID